MKNRLLVCLILCVPALFAQVNPVQELIEAARADSPKLAELLGKKDSFGYRIPELNARDGVAVWGQEFLFAVENANEATVAIDGEPAVPMKRVAGTNYWYLLKMLRLGTTHQYHYFANGREVGGGYQVAGYNPDSYPQAGVPHGKLSEKQTLVSKVYPGMSSNYWVYVNAGADLTNGAPVMVWQDGETIVGNQDWVRLRLQTVSDNLVAQKKIPPMVHVLIQPGTGGEAQMMRSIQYDTVSERYGKYLIDEVLADVQQTYKIRQDAYSRAIGGASSGAICAMNVAWYYPQQFSRVLSHIGSYSGIQWHPERNQDGGYIVSFRVRREQKKNVRVWMSDGSDDIENQTGSWPLNNIQLANAFKMKGYDFHFRFGVSMHAIAQGALDLPESLTWLWRGYDPAKTEQVYEMEPAERAKPLFRVSITNRDAW